MVDGPRADLGALDRCPPDPHPNLHLRVDRQLGGTVFRCDIFRDPKDPDKGKVTAPKEPQTKVVWQTREKTYVNYIPDIEGDCYHNDMKCRKVESKGWEIVKELNVSLEGLALLAKLPADPSVN